MKTQSIQANASTSNASGDRWRDFIVATLAITVLFALPLIDLVQYGLENSLYSHAWLLPFVAAYLIWTGRSKFTQLASPKKPAWSILPLGLAALALLAYGLNRDAWTGDAYVNYLSSVVFAYVMLVFAAAFWFLGIATLRAIAFPLFIALFTAPFPVFIQDGIETFFQYTSAETAYWMIKLAGTPIFRDGLVFQLSSISMEVAPQCSGIRSSLVLFITSLVASYMFLESPWKRAAIILFIVPLAIARNGLRIFTLGQLCEYFGPQMIDTWIHHRGGPVFFALSLIPFFLLLHFLWKSEKKPRAT